MFYIDKGNAAFRQSRNSEYIDKSGLIAVVNKTLFTELKFTCVRPLFADLQIAQDPFV